MENGDEELTERREQDVHSLCKRCRLREEGKRSGKKQQREHMEMRKQIVLRVTLNGSCESLPVIEHTHREEVSRQAKPHMLVKNFHSYKYRVHMT